MRSLTLLTIALCVAVPLTFGGLAVAGSGDAATAGVAEADVIVEDVGIAPSTPSPGESATVQVTVTNNGSSTVEFSSLAVRTTDPLEEYGRNRDPGSVAPGETTTVEVEVTFDETDVYDLQILLGGSAGNEEFTKELDRRVTVRERGPTVVMSADDPVEGAETTVEMTVANGEAEPVRNVRIRLDGPGFSVEDPVRVEPELQPGDRTVFSFTVVPESVGEQRLTARIDFVESDGEERTVSDVQFFEVAAVEEDASLTVSSVGAGPRPDLQAELINLGNAPLTDVVYTVYDEDGEPVTQQTGADVPVDETVRTVINVTGVDEADLTVEASYRTGSLDGTVSDTEQYTANPGQIELTGVEVQQRPDSVLLRGDASNTGLSDAQGVVVRVVDADGVDPVQPNGEFFVGDVPASDFAQFDLTASVDEDRSTVPIQVQYIADGERVTNVVEVDVEASNEPAPDTQSTPPDDESGGFGLLTAVLTLVGIGVLGIAGYGVYRSRQ